MNNQIKSEIKELSEIIFEQTNKLISYEQGAPLIEVDLAKENIRRLYEKLELLITENGQANHIAHEEIKKLNNIEEAIDDQVDELLNIAAAQFEGDIEQINQQIIEQEEVIEEQAEVIDEEIAFIEDDLDPIKEVAKTPDTEKKIVTEETPSPNNESAVVGDRLTTKPISSLKSAIGINDKFQFINELFDGSMQTFNQAISQLDQAGELKAATSIFNSISSERKWDEENPAVIQLQDYINRRFL